MTETSMSVIENLAETLILWDVDHTLIENGGVSKETYALAYELLVGQPPLVRPVTHGRTDFQIMRELLIANAIDADPYAEIEDFLDVLLEAMDRKAPELPRRGYVLPGVIEVLTALSSIPKVIQSALTGNIAPNAQVKVSAFGLDRFIDLEVGGYGSDDKVRSNLVNAARRKIGDKYGIEFDRSSTILVGDTPLDVKAARDGGAKIIAVATGVHPIEELRNAGAEVALASMADVDRFFAALADVRTN